MAVAHRASIGCSPTNPTTTFTVTIPATVVSGDVLFLSVTNRDGVGATPTVVDTDSGGNTWVRIANDANMKGTLWYKRATSGTASKVITVAACIGSAVGTLSCYYGTDTGATPYSNISVEVNTAGNETHAAMTPDVNVSMVCLVVHNVGNDNAVSGQTTIEWANLTQRIEDLSTGGSDCGCNHSSALGSGNSGAITWAQTDGATISIVWAIKPPAGVVHYGVAILAGVGTLAGIGSFILKGLATLSGTGLLSAIGQVFKLGSAVLSGVGTLVAKGIVILIGKAILAGVGSLAGIGKLILTGKSTLSGVGSLIAKGIGIFIGKATLIGEGLLSAIGTVITGGVIHYGSATLSGIGTLVVKGVGIFIGKVTLAGIGLLSTIGTIIKGGGGQSPRISLINGIIHIRIGNKNYLMA